MSELKEHLFVPYSELREGDELTDAFTIAKSYYLKSEADKVIVRNKYKRCLAMAQVLAHILPMTNRKAKWRDKWHKRWLAIANKFKEAK